MLQYSGGSSDYSDITELPGAMATREQSTRLLNRYQTANSYAASRRVLEIACGSGLGLGYLARSARWVIGGDYTSSLLRLAQSHYRGRLPLTQLDAHDLPFGSASFDLALIFEALYYMERPERVLAETRRILDKRGIVLVSTVNKDWSGFSPSRHSTRYFSIPELRGLLIEAGFDRIEFFGAFPAEVPTLIGRSVSLLRRVAVSLHLVPKTLGSRALLKRLFYGKLSPLGPEVKAGMAPSEPLVQLSNDSATKRFKIIYAKATVR